MPRRDPRSARFLGLWTAGWLAVLLGAGLMWVGDLSLQWPVLGVPLLWALVASRPRRERAADRVDHGWAPELLHDGTARRRPVPGRRTDTVERPSVRQADHHRD